MDGKLFLGTARLLQSKGSDEPAYRSAVSRAYYACFLEARRVAFENCDEGARGKAGIGNPRGIKHEPLQRYLKNSSCRTIQKIGEDLAALCGNRQDADYNMTRSLISEDSRQAIEDADAFLSAFVGVDPKKIGCAVSKYIRQTHA